MLSKESLELVPYWQRELKESPQLMGHLERDVNNAIQVLYKITHGDDIGAGSLLAT